MKELVQFPLEGGGTVVAEIDDQEPGFERVARSDRIAEAGETFQAALEKVQPAAIAVIDGFKAAAPDQITLEFGIRLNFKAGAVLASSEGEGHFQVQLTWKPPTGDL
jgi:Trypsin-co-occurring domain 1